jgi:hypothetical protein
MSDDCPICEKEKEAPPLHDPEPDLLTTYRPLLIVLAVIFALTIGQLMLFHQDSARSFMSLFMGWFFIVFAISKFIDLRGFADGFAMYDLIAQRSRAYAHAYPFIELGLGLAYMAELSSRWVYIVTAIVMAVGSAGVINSLRKKQKIHCACLGAWIKLPLGTISLLEDVGMGLMAVAMLVMG